MATYRLKLICGESVEFADDCLIAYDVLCMDDSQHRIKDFETGNFIGSKRKPIYIGRNCWITSRCTILPGTVLPSYTIVVASSVLNKDYSSFGEYIMIGGSPTRILKQNVYLDRKDN